MKAVLVLVSMLFGANAFAAELGGFYDLSCSYTSAGQVKNPIVTIDIKSVDDGDEGYISGMTLSVAYILKGKKVIENAEVESFDGEYPTGLVTARTQSGRLFQVFVDSEKQENNARIYVDGIKQTHMKDLSCSIGYAG